MGPPNGADFASIYTGTGFKFGNKPVSALFNGPEGIIVIALFVAGVLLLIYTTMAGISLMTTKGDPKMVASGKQRLTNGVIGFIIVFTAYWIVQIVGILLGLDGFAGSVN